MTLKSSVEITRTMNGSMSFSLGSFPMWTLLTSKYHPMLTLSTHAVKISCMDRSVHPRARKKSAKPYHHGDLRRALLDEAVRTIQTHGVEHLTLRTVGERLGV